MVQWSTDPVSYTHLSATPEGRGSSGPGSKDLRGLIFPTSILAIDTSERYTALRCFVALERKDS